MWQRPLNHRWALETEKEIITIEPIQLEWSPWTPWPDLEADARGGGANLPTRPGVYEVRYADAEERLTVGKASDLRMRVKQGLVRGRVPHSAGERIRAYEDTKRLLVRWAVTDRPAAVEEELHRRHRERFSRLPKYVQHT